MLSLNYLSSRTYIFVSFYYNYSRTNHCVVYLYTRTYLYDIYAQYIKNIFLYMVSEPILARLLGLSPAIGPPLHISFMLELKSL